MLSNSEVIINLSFVSSKIMKQVDNELSVHGISFSELMVMYHLQNSSNKTMRRINLADSIGLTASGVTRLLNPMERRKLIKKKANPRDARVSLVKLSPSGVKIFAEAMASFEHVSGRILESFDQNQTTQLSGLIRLLL